MSQDRETLPRHKLKKKNNNYKTLFGSRSLSQILHKDTETVKTHTV